jgi:hypothetical protein
MTRDIFADKLFILVGETVLDRAAVLSLLADGDQQSSKIVPTIAVFDGYVCMLHKASLTEPLAKRGDKCCVWFREAGSVWSPVAPASQPAKPPRHRAQQ